MTESMDIIKEYLFTTYQERGNKDFFLSSRFVARKLNLSIPTVSMCLRILRSKGIVRFEKRRMWSTTFNQEKISSRPIWKIVSDFFP